MVTKRIRSEYMKKFKDPKWETYTKCYEEMLRYRLTRRLLEHTHNPFLWSGSDTDSESGSRSPPQPSKNQVQSEACRDVVEQAELEECGEARMDRQQHLQEEKEEEQENTSARLSALHGSQVVGGTEARAPEGRTGSSRGAKQLMVPHREEDKEKDTKPSKSSKPAWHSKRVRPAPAARPPREDVGKESSRHPFALYGSGEKDADMAGRKTHNVGPAASTKEIHDAALRAKTRREVGRQVQTQRTERRRAKSADVDKDRKLLQPEYNPWLTEYMRCFSARSR